MKSILGFALTCLLFSTVSAFRLGILSDIHIGEGCPSPYNYEEDCYSIQSAKRTVDFINSNLSQSIDLIIITGDITGSAQQHQYQKAYEVLSGLNVPWVPLIGNHDTWPYSATWEHEKPDGDAYFGEVFGEHLRKSKFVSHYPNISAFDSYHNAT
jgi:3',5'-cyclic AMP phosphodiesterase CpdA